MKLCLFFLIVLLPGCAIKAKQRYSAPSTSAVHHNVTNAKSSTGKAKEEAKLNEVAILKSKDTTLSLKQKLELLKTYKK